MTKEKHDIAEQAYKAGWGKGYDAGVTTGGAELLIRINVLINAALKNEADSIIILNTILKYLCPVSDGE